MTAQQGDRVRPTSCRRCGQNYGWRGGISFDAVRDLGRRVREHYDTNHPGVDPAVDARTLPSPADRLDREDHR